MTLDEARPDSPWAAHARRWCAVGSPLRPAPEDVRLIAEHCRITAACRILLLGVTPELAAHNWPNGTQVTAADLHLPMIRQVWPGNAPARTAVCANWLALPFARDQFDIVIGDGCLTLLDYPSQYGALSSSISSVLKPTGRWVMRQFCRPAVPETLAAIGDALWRGAIGNVHVLKWRIAMALHGDQCTHGVSLDDIWQAYRRLVVAPTRLVERLGWTSREVATLEHYRGCPARYTFPLVGEIALAMPEFDVRAVGHGSYELAERCPILSLRPHPRHHDPE